ncbi:pyridoxal phosphate-dependent transferase [Terfezia claveryi]|nr:pyridoxal phosphate-dependent transferase [Terfezia claveryi]
MDFDHLTNVISASGAPAPSDTSYALSHAYADSLDLHDPLSIFRSQFHIPTTADLASTSPPPASASIEPTHIPSPTCIYFCGNSLGLQPKRTAALINDELAIWATRGVTGHFRHPKYRPWVSIDENVSEHLAGIVGAKPSEVAAMGSLTGNIHLLLAGFYKPKENRYKVIMEGRAFPSDHYAIVSQLQWHGHTESSALVLIDPIAPYSTLTTNQILSTIDQHADSTALLFLSGVQYYTGQAFDMATITKFAQSKGITVGWDLAHAAGNIELKLHEWGALKAVWCSYKYLNSGPGGIAGIFVHERHDLDPNTSTPRHRLAGWWGHDRVTRFQMDTQFLPLPGAPGYQLSNPSILDTTAHLASLELFTKATPAALQRKSRLLTSYLYFLLTHPPEGTSDTLTSYYAILTPLAPSDRGAQLSIKFTKPGLMDRVFAKLTEKGVVVDERRPDVIRVAPAPLFNRFREVWVFGAVLWWKCLGAGVSELEKREGW